ncbi:hypothetical protein [Duganella callida]|uniref:Uncharacterized protein n=1 Tax=Duganella callida TaxID=2561932 RepID=A0A4Y9SRN2_9BURK|nr:hypothetical protein [Duganella callida]TFW29452.1 hypothetical protein E4L98_03725 [Duganella callida]
MYEAIKKILLVDLPSLDFYPKLALSLVLMSISLFLLVSMWRDPARASSIDPATEARLKAGVTAFFANMGDNSPAVPVVFGNAKDMVRRFKTEKNVFENVGLEIENRKQRDNNWKFANELSAAKALVNALGLDYDTTKENQIFLQMPLPITEASSTTQALPSERPR